MTNNDDQLNIKALGLFERALEMPSADRAGWIRSHADNDAVRDKALSYLSQDANTKAAIQTGGAFLDTLDDTAIPEHIGAYQISGLIGRGGMGSVYRGERSSNDFEHDVAIKVVRPGTISNKLIERFQRERQTLAKLVHPHIARLYDGGTLANGAPYMVMEFINGLPITDWVENEIISQDQRLKLFKDVCRAVSYAHQNLIIHRDITPSNVLVDTDGNVKLIDFGIAKPFDEDAVIVDTASSLASLSFTPGFAAPERSKGAGANTLSDIYSLGKLLRALIGDRPDAQLAAVIDKATAHEPDARYETVNALTGDIENYRGGYPVLAAKVRPTYRFKKFISRHKVGTFLSGVAALGLIVTFAATVFQYQQAERARHDANNRFNEVRELANFMLFDLYNQLKIVPGNTQSLTDIADKSRSYLDALATDENASLALNLETLIGYKRLSDVTGNPVTVNLGRRKDAKELLEKAYHGLQRLHDENPRDVTITRAFADAAFSFSVFKFIADDETKFTKIYAEQAAALYQSIRDENKNVEHDDIYYFKSLLQSARTYYWDDRGEEGIVILKALAQDIEKYVVDHPDSTEAKRVNAAINSETGLSISSHYSLNGGDVNEAIPYIDSAIATQIALMEADPEDFTARRNIIGNYYKRALIYSGLENSKKMLNDLVVADDILSDLLEKDPDDNGLRRIALSVWELKSKTFSRLGRHSEALALGQKNLDAHIQLVKNDPDSAGRAREFGNAQASFAKSLKMANEIKKSCEMYRRALATWTMIGEKWTLTEYDKKDVLQKLKIAVHDCQ